MSIYVRNTFILISLIGIFCLALLVAPLGGCVGKNAATPEDSVIPFIDDDDDPLFQPDPGDDDDNNDTGIADDVDDGPLFADDDDDDDPVADDDDDDDGDTQDPVVTEDGWLESSSSVWNGYSDWRAEGVELLLKYIKQHNIGG